MKVLMRGLFFYETQLCLIILCGDYFASAQIVGHSNDELFADGCHKVIVVKTYAYLSLSPNVNYCTWSVSLDNPESHRDKELKFQIESVGTASVFVYDGRTGYPIASFDKHNGSSRMGSQASSKSGKMFIKYRYDGDPQYLPGFNATVRLKGICIPGTSPCGDGENCYTESEMCDGIIQCATAYDELGCGGCPANQFWCGRHDGTQQCYTSVERCNGQKECSRTNQDETECHSCGHGAVLCKSSKRCIYERWICDQDADCTDGSDEEGCIYPASRRVITAAIIGALVCSLLLVISLGCTCKLYSLRTAHSRRNILHSTPLTRVEREIFARQAPPTYEMTVSGIDPDAVNARQQRNRRRRSRRYPFQRSAPARDETQAGDNREEGVQAHPQETTSNNTSSAVNTQTNQAVTGYENNTLRSQQRRSSTLQSLGSFFFESIRSSSSGTSTSRNNAQGTGARTSSRSRGSQNETPTRSGNRRSTSSGRSRSSRSSNSDQQAKPLPKKKRILPVRVPAPCEDGAVEEDLLACVYPTPPSYSQATLTDETKAEKDLNNCTATNSEANISLNISSEDVVDGDDDVAINETLTSQAKGRFSFSLTRALQKLAASSFRRFRQNPYHQMASQESRRNSEQESHDVLSIDENNCFVLPVQTRGSTSSDEDLLDCSLQNSARYDEVNDVSPSRAVTLSQDAQASSNKKMFPQRRLGNLPPSRMKDDDCDSINMFDLSPGERM